MTLNKDLRRGKCKEKLLSASVEYKLRVFASQLPSLEWRHIRHQFEPTTYLHSTQKRIIMANFTSLSRHTCGKTAYKTRKYIVRVRKDVATKKLRSWGQHNLWLMCLSNQSGGYCFPKRILIYQRWEMNQKSFDNAGG